MHSRYEQRPGAYGAPPRRDNRYASPPQNRGRPEYPRERSPYQSRDRYAPYSNHHASESNGYRDNDRRYPPPARTSGRYGAPPRTYSPPPAYSSSRRYNDQYPPARNDYPQRESYRPPRRDAPVPQSSYPSSRNSRDYNPPPTRSYRPPLSRRDPSTKPPPREMSPVRGELLPTTVKFMNMQDQPSRPERREHSRDDYDRPAPSYRRDEPPRSRPHPRDSYDRPSSYRGSRPYRGRRGSTRGGHPPRFEVSPIRLSGDEVDQERNGNSPQKRRRPSTPPRSRSRTATPPSKILAIEPKRNGHKPTLEDEEDMLEFEDEVDPESIEAATKAHPQRPQIMPPNVEDLNLMDAAGEINERASTSVDCPLSPASTVSEEIRYLSADSFDKISAYVQGQVDSSVDDYKILEDMNKTTAQRYQDMHKVAETITTRLQTLNGKYQTLRPQLEQIDQIDEASKRLENTVGALEKYFNSLESKFKQIRSSPTRSQN